jgi:hypothetical protein
MIHVFKIIKISSYLLSITPLLFVFSLLQFYIHTGLELEHLPQPSIDDPKNLWLYNFYAPIIEYTFKQAFICIMILGIVSVILAGLNRSQIMYKPFLIATFSCIVATLIFFSKITEWFAD